MYMQFFNLIDFSFTTGTTRDYATRDLDKKPIGDRTSDGCVTPFEYIF